MSEEKIEHLDGFALLKQLKVIVETKLSQGKSKTETYNELSAKIKKSFAKNLKSKIAFYVYHKKRKVFDKKNKILLGLTVISGILIVPMLIQFYSNISFTKFHLFFALMYVAIQVQLIFGIFKWNGRIYKSIVIVEIFKLIALYTEYKNGYYTEWILIYGLILLAEIILAYWLYKNIFPNYSWSGPKKLENGEYDFDSDNLN